MVSGTMGQVPFYGKFFHTTDPSARVILPVRFRSNLGEQFRVVGGPDRRLCVMPTSKFEEFIEEVLEAATHLRSLFDTKIDKLRHALISNTEDGATDIQGRMQVTEAHRDYAGIEPKSEVVIVGVGEWCEIWSRANWEAYEKGLDGDSVREAGLSVDDIWKELARAQDAGVSHTCSGSTDTGAA